MQLIPVYKKESMIRSLIKHDPINYSFEQVQRPVNHLYQISTILLMNHFDFKSKCFHQLKVPALKILELIFT
jgi:hypothetical protein